MLRCPLRDVESKLLYHILWRFAGIIIHLFGIVQKRSDLILEKKERVKCIRYSISTNGLDKKQEIVSSLDSETLVSPYTRLQCLTNDSLTAA